MIAKLHCLGGHIIAVCGNKHYVVIDVEITRMSLRDAYVIVRGDIYNYGIVEFYDDQRVQVVLKRFLKSCMDVVNASEI